MANCNCIEEEMAKMMKIGTRVVRGRDWSSGSLDGAGVGTIIGGVYYVSIF